MSSLEKSPAYRWYPKDVETDEFWRRLKRDVRDLYRQLLDWAWLENGLPDDDEAIYDHVFQRGDDAAWLAESWSKLKSKFVLGPNGRLVNLKMEREREKQKSFAEKQRQKGQKRWASKDEPLSAPAVAEDEPKNSRGLAPAQMRLSILANANANAQSESASEIPDRVGEAKPKPPPKPELDVLAALNASRKRVIRGARDLSATETNLKHIRARLKEHGLDDCLHVVAVCEADVKVNPAAEEWFNAVSPFLPDNFARKVARSVNGPRPAPKANGFSNPAAQPRNHLASQPAAAVIAAMYGEKA